MNQAIIVGCHECKIEEKNGKQLKCFPDEKHVMCAHLQYHFDMSSMKSDWEF